MDILLNHIQARALGALIEKEITTPDYYPLSLNALVNACNQKNNREPVMNVDETGVREALERLQEHLLAGPARGADSRVSKYEHRLQEVFNLSRAETAVLCVLLLRGPQTPGELRGRTERMYRFEHLDDVQSALQRLSERDPPLARMLPRQPGTKESRYVHLLSGDVEDAIPAIQHRPRSLAASDDADRFTRLEEELAHLRSDIAEIKEQLAQFRRQFE
ncbi:MAG TPA: YceH family protein [Terriglobales bacterium]|jgi:uncharacterized protein YceH (UPF0502 family)|nr:YceH family protein [Terriglobales bacterium]